MRSEAESSSDFLSGIVRLNNGTGCFEFGFVEREATPRPEMKLGLRLHLEELSLSDTMEVSQQSCR